MTKTTTHIPANIRLTQHHEAPPSQNLLLGRARAGRVVRVDAAFDQCLGNYLYFILYNGVFSHLVSLRNLGDIPACDLRHPVVHSCAMPALHNCSKSVPPVLSSVYVLAGNSMPPCLDWGVPCVLDNSRIFLSSIQTWRTQRTLLKRISGMPALREAFLYMVRD